MQTLSALVFLIAAVAACIWAWRRTFTALSHRGWRALPSHCLGVLTFALMGVLALFALAMAVAPGIAMIGRLTSLLVAASMLFAFWRVTSVGATKAQSNSRAMSAVATDAGTPSLAAVAVQTRSVVDEPRPTSFSFIYRKPDGTSRRRTVRVDRHGFDGSSKYVEGHCDDANAARTFRLDRIEGKVTAMETGELISAAAMYRRLGDPSPSLEVTNFSQAARAPRSSRRSNWQTAVYFAGFGINQHSDLAELAEAAGMDVRYTISRTVDYVVTGNMAGRQQLAQAETYGIPVIDERTFRSMV